MELILDSLLDALKDGALSIPILFLAYLLMELLERSKKLDESILHAYSRKAGPALGGLLGAIPQCGISGAAATLFSTGTITVGTMLAVFFATSDEMLPVMLSSVSDANGIGMGSILLVGYLSLYTAIGTIALIYLLVLAMILPMTYTNMRYVLTDGTGYWSNLFGHYGKGMRRW